MAPRPNRTCATCGAWQEPAAEEELGTCRLNPPVLAGDKWEFPSSAPHWWCAKWINQSRLKVVDGKEDA